MIALRRLICFTVIVVFVGGCGSATTTANPTSTFSTPKSSQPTPTTGNFEPQLETRLSPSLTEIPSATPDITQTAFVQGIISTQFAGETLAPLFPHGCELLYAPREFSPDRSWMVEFCPADDGRDYILAFSNREKQLLWKLYYKDYVPQLNNFPDGGMSVLHWTNDGRFAYFFSHLGGDGVECFYNAPDRGAGLFRVDLQTGHSTAILPLDANFSWYSFSFSPTGRRLVYGVQARGLKILDIRTGESANINLVSEFDEGGGFLWSEDGLELVYSTLIRDDQGERESYTLRLVDVQTGNEQILIESHENCFAPLSWTENNILTLKKNYFEAIVEFDLSTNAIISESSITP